METISKNTRIGDVVAENFKTSAVFTAFGIDFCCGGNKTIEEVLAGDNEKFAAIQKDLLEVLNQQKSDENYRTMSLTELINHIYSTHHKYVEAQVPLLKGYLEKIASVHGRNHPELIKIKELFEVGSAALVPHMKKEEIVLFPYIKAMEKKSINGTVEKGDFSVGQVENPINSMKHDHNEEGERFREIRALANDFKVPEDACSTYRVSFQMLEEFEQDLHLHIHLENNILFEKAIALEQKIND